MNKERLKFIADWLRTGALHEPDGLAFHMDVWYTQDAPEEAYAAPWVGECGSVMCIGGAAWYFFGDRKRSDMKNSCEMLGISLDVGNQLFYPWDVSDIDDSKMTPQYCAKVIDNLIETGKVDWDIG